jgi:dTDP-glucose 4,6-dehydratase
MQILITGGAGFIGSHVVRLFTQKYPDYHIVNLDALTYAGNLENLADIHSDLAINPTNQAAKNYQFIKADIRDRKAIFELFELYNFDAIIHLAAESHVDRSIESPVDFVETNVIGTMNLLDAAKHIWAKKPQTSTNRRLFYQVSTDEVYGSLGETGFFTETTAYSPRSPYSASKAAADHLVMAYFHTYNLPALISNCSNNYGANQFPEKLIPLCIHNIKQQKPLPIYGNGDYTRDWLWVEDHARAIDTIFHKGLLGENYNVGGHNEWKNIDLVRLLCDLADQELGKAIGSSQKLITFVKDRAGHDKRYAIDAAKIERTLGWKPSVTFEAGLLNTLRWYLQNEQWLENVTSGVYKNYYQQQYTDR